MKTSQAPHLLIDIGEELPEKAYIDTGAFTSFISDEFLQQRFPQQTPSLRKFPGKVLDANGNEVKILGEIKSNVITPTSSFYTSVLIFKKNTAVRHHILLGITILKYCNINFSTNEIIFHSVENNVSTTSDDVLQLSLTNPKIYGVLHGQEICTPETNETKLALVFNVAQVSKELT